MVLTASMWRAPRIFPTSGYANPTLMILALAIRLADEIKRQLAE